MTRSLKAYKQTRAPPTFSHILPPTTFAWDLFELDNMPNETTTILETALGSAEVGLA